MTSQSQPCGDAKSAATEASGYGRRAVTATRYSYSARTPLPPGYAVEYWDEDEMWHWVLKRCPDDVNGGDTWNHWRCWREAWAHYSATLQAAPTERVVGEATHPGRLRAEQPKIAEAQPHEKED